MATTEPLAQLVQSVLLERRERQAPLEPPASRVYLVLPDLMVRVESLETEVSLETRDCQDLLGSRESVVTQDLPARLDLRDLSVLVALPVPLAPMVARGSLALADLLVTLDTRELEECPVSAVLAARLEPRERRVRVDTEAWRVTLEEMAPVVPPDPADPPDLPVPTVTRVRRVRSVLLALLVFVVPLESVVSRALLDLLVSPDPLVLRDRLEPEERRDLLEGKETSVPLALPDPPDSLDPRVMLDLLAPLVLVVIAVLPV